MRRVFFIFFELRGRFNFLFLFTLSLPRFLNGVTVSQYVFAVNICKGNSVKNSGNAAAKIFFFISILRAKKYF